MSVDCADGLQPSGCLPVRGVPPFPINDSRRLPKVGSSPAYHALYCSVGHVFALRSWSSACDAVFLSVCVFKIEFSGLLLQLVGLRQPGGGRTIQTDSPVQSVSRW